MKFRGKKVMKKPNLAIAKRLFKKRNPKVKFTATWKIKPVLTSGGWVSSVRFEVEGYIPVVRRLYSDNEGIALF